CKFLCWSNHSVWRFTRLSRYAIITEVSTITISACLLPHPPMEVPRPASRTPVPLPLLQELSCAWLESPRRRRTNHRHDPATRSFRADSRSPCPVDPFAPSTSG